MSLCCALRVWAWLVQLFFTEEYAREHPEHILIIDEIKDLIKEQVSVAVAMLSTPCLCGGLALRHASSC